MDAGAARPRLFDWGNTFLHPALDYLLIGGGLSLIVVAASWAFAPNHSADALLGAMPLLFLLSNSAHFAASTVRLYTKPGALRALPFLTMMLPVVSIAVASAAIAFPAQLGRHLTALYLTWSPYHYSAQAYGLAVMYAYRSGVKLTDAHKRALRWCCLLTFVRVLVAVPTYGVGIWWVIPWEPFAPYAASRWVLEGISLALALATGVLLVRLYASVIRTTGRPLPAITVLIVLVNALWFFAFRYLSGMVWATVFHGIQYHAIVTIFHVKEKLREPGNRRGWLHHTAWFYGASLVLAYLLFQCWPSFYEMLGFGYVESSILVVAVINVHHFIVDAYIWRLRKDPNYRTVTSGGVTSGAVTAGPSLEPHSTRGMRREACPVSAADSLGT
jgi:hypothetical protein